MGGATAVSPVNVLMNWAVAAEPTRYDIVPVPSETQRDAALPPWPAVRDGIVATAVFAANRPPSYRWRRGCCRAHGAEVFPGCTPAEVADTAHISYTSQGAWSSADRAAVADAAYALIAAQLSTLPREEVLRMRAACALAYPALARSQVYPGKTAMKMRTRTATATATRTASRHSSPEASETGDRQ